MNLAEIFEQIENQEYEFQLGLASGFKTFQYILEKTPAYQELLKAVKDVSVAKAVVDHLFRLLDDRGDLNYAHPHDKSIAVYMVAVMEKHPRLLEKLLADDVNPSGLFWTRFAAEKLSKILVNNLALLSSPVRYFEFLKDGLVIREEIKDISNETSCQGDTLVISPEIMHIQFEITQKSNSGSKSVNFDRVA